MATKITKSELKQMIREALREELYTEQTEPTLKRQVTDQYSSVCIDGSQVFMGTKEACEDWVNKHIKQSNKHRVTIKGTAEVMVLS